MRRGANKLIQFSLFLFSLLVIAGHSYAATVSLDHVFVANDVFAADFHTRLNRDLTQIVTGGVNSINAANVADDSLGEAEMADEINPRIRTYEGAACEYVYTGLLPVTDSDLTTDTSAGTAYPRGYRINKGSATSHSYTASKWTFVDLDINGDFQYSEVAIGGATPSVASNAIRLARVSSDASTIANVQDLRRTSCTNGPFSVISDTTGEATLSDVLKYGHHNRQSGDIGWVQGLKVSWDTATTFRVQSGSAYIGGKYRFASTDITVPQTADNPSTSVSGIDTSSIAANTRYTVYAVADEEAVPGFSVSYSTSSAAPSGVTNYRKIGTIKTDGSSKFASYDVMTTHEINQKEIIGAWVSFKTVGVTTILKSYNVASLTDNGTGDTTISFERPFVTSQDYVIAGAVRRSLAYGGYVAVDEATTPTKGAVRVETIDNNGSSIEDMELVTLMAVGERP